MASVVQTPAEGSKEHRCSISLPRTFRRLTYHHPIWGDASLHHAQECFWPFTSPGDGVFRSPKRIDAEITVSSEFLFIFDNLNDLVIGSHLTLQTASKFELYLYW